MERSGDRAAGEGQSSSQKFLSSQRNPVPLVLHGSGSSAAGKDLASPWLSLVTPSLKYIVLFGFGDLVGRFSDDRHVSRYTLTASPSTSVPLPLWNTSGFFEVPVTKIEQPLNCCRQEERRIASRIPSLGRNTQATGPPACIPWQEPTREPSSGQTPGSPVRQGLEVLGWKRPCLPGGAFLPAPRVFFCALSG